MNCPRCQENLRQAQRMAVEIDFCPRCRGIWLDGGELEKLMRRAQDYDVVPLEDSRESGPYPPPPPDIRRYDRQLSDERHQRDKRGYHRDGQDRPKRKKSFFSELIDIFD